MPRPEPQIAEPRTGGTALTLDDLKRQRIWGIVAADTPGAIDPPQPARFLLDCKLRGVPVLSEAGFCEQHLGRVDLDTLTVPSLTTPMSVVVPPTSTITTCRNA